MSDGERPPWEAAILEACESSRCPYVVIVLDVPGVSAGDVVTLRDPPYWLGSNIGEGGIPRVLLGMVRKLNQESQRSESEPNGGTANSAN